MTVSRRVGSRILERFRIHLCATVTGVLEELLAQGNADFGRKRVTEDGEGLQVKGFYFNVNTNETTVNGNLGNGGKVEDHAV